MILESERLLLRPWRAEDLEPFAAMDNAKSRRVMEKLGMTHDPKDDFPHPLLAGDHRLGPHVLYRLRPPVTP